MNNPVNNTNQNTKPVNAAQPAQPSIANKTLAEPMEGSISEGFNLMPGMTKAEKAVETKKSTFNIGSAISLIVLVVSSIAIVGFNIISKQQLNSIKSKLYAQENVVNQKVDIISANNAILDRINLYQTVEKNKFSHKEVINFIQSMATKAGNVNLNNIQISDNLGFSFDGKAVSLEDASKLWYLLGIDNKIKTVNLKSIGKATNEVRFTFEGTFVADDFINNGN